MSIYYEDINSNKMIIGVLNTLRHNFIFSELEEVIVPILKETMLHEHSAVNEETIRVLEDWHNSTALELLYEMPKYKSFWLEDYKQTIIREIENNS